MRTTERLIVFAVVFTMALGLSLTMNPGVLPWYGVALAAMACAAVPYMLHAEPGYRFSPLRLILPAAIALAAPSAAHALGDGGLRLLGVFGPGALLYGVILAESAIISPIDSSRAAAARLLLTVAGYGVALAFFMLLYQGKERALISAPLAGAVSGALALRLMTLEHAPDRRTLAYASVAAVSMAELLWPLNYWVLGVSAGALALLLGFYVLVGVLRQLQSGQLNQAVVLEWSTVSVAGMLVVFGASRL